MLPISTLEQMLVESDSKYFWKIDSAKIRMAIIHALKMLPLPCRGEKEDADLFNLKDDLDRMGKGEKPEFHSSSKEVIEALAKRVRESLESDLKF